MENSGENFSLGLTIFILPNLEENCGEESALTALLQKCPHNGYKHNNLSLKHLYTQHNQA